MGGSLRAARWKARSEPRPIVRRLWGGGVGDRQEADGVSDKPYATIRRSSARLPLHVRRARLRRHRRSPRSQHSVREIHAPERPHRHPQRGPPAPAGRGRHLVPRRRRQPGPRQERLRPPVRAHAPLAGTKHLGLEPFQDPRVGGGLRRAMANGTTSEDRTNYFEILPPSELPTALWLESDRMGFLLDTLDEKKLNVQRDVVSNERRQSYENRPYGTAELRTCDVFYPKPHPYYDCVIGTIAEIQSASLDDLRGFFRQFYGPNNASHRHRRQLRSGAAKALVAQYFGPIPRGPDVVRPDIPQPQLPGVVKETLQRSGRQDPPAAARLGRCEDVRSRRARGGRARAHSRRRKASRLYQELSRSGRSRPTSTRTTRPRGSAASSSSRRRSKKGTRPRSSPR